MNESNAYRLNVGLIIVNDFGKVLLCRRQNTNRWQFPQGGIDGNEKPVNAAKREMFEEVGIKPKSVKLIGKTTNWVEYKVPREKIKLHFKKKGIIGQRQKWFMFKLKEDVDISFDNDPDNEFDSYSWVSYWHPLSKIVSFKRHVYQRVLHELLHNYNNEFLNDN